MASVFNMDAIKAFFPEIGKYAFSAGATLPPMSYGERLAKAMEQARVDRAKLAAALEISVQAVGQVLNGQTKAFTADKSAKAARLLRVDHYWLATGEGEPKPPGPSEEALEFARRYDRLDTDGRAKFSAAIVIAQQGVPDAKVEERMPITARRSRERTD
jgi:transcriptional regulator with XRE-family HTH domain